MKDYPLAAWRLIRSAPADGATNMAVDEAILRSVADGAAPPALRVYAWEPGCLSLGRGQPVDDADLEALEAAGFDLVRRPTGGRAILHIDELTYSVVAPRTEPRLAGGVVESYRRLSRGLVCGLERVGVPDIVADRRAENRRLQAPVCFEISSDYEVAVDGRKLVGSAQMRRRGVVLQHGAVPLYGDIARICPLLAGHPDPARVRAHATTVEETLGHRITWSEAADAVVAGFAEALNLRFKPVTLTGEEHVWMDRLRAEKYATERWTMRI